MHVIDLDLRHLRLVAAVHETGSATLAASRLGVTQSAVSHQLRDLESRLEAPAFTRSGKRLVLTPAGRRVLEAAQAVTAELDRAAADLRRLRDGGTGTLRLSAQCHTGYHWLPQVLREFRGQHPHVEVEIAVQHTARTVAAVLEGSLDLALVTDTVRDRRLRVRKLASDEHVAIVSRKHPWAAKPFITPEDLAGEDLLLYSMSPNESFTVRRILEPAGLRPSRVRFVQLTEAILEMVKAGLGVTVMPAWVVRPALKGGALRMVRITRGGIYRDWSAATLAGATEPPYIGDFIDLVRGSIGPRG